MMIRHRRFLAFASLVLLAWALGATWIGHTCQTGCAGGLCGDHLSVAVTSTDESTLIPAGACPACLLTRHLQTVDTRACIGDLPSLAVLPLTPTEPESEDLIWAIAARTRGPPTP